MNEPLESLIKRAASKLKAGEIDPRVESFEDYKSKYMVLKPKVTVTIELTSGKIAKVDVTDYFEGEIK